MSHILTYAIVVCCMLATLQTSGQIQDPEPRTGRPPIARHNVIDTIPSKSFITPGNFYSTAERVYDTLDYDFHRYNPARRAPYPYATLGNLGSPARSLYYAMPMPKGLNPGHHAFDLYKADFDYFRFYDTNVALSRLEYSQGLSQEDGIIRAEFGRNFDKGVNFSLNYQRINQKGQFQLQRAKNTAFGIGLLYRSPKGKLDGIYHYLSNSIVHEDNGGVDIPEIDSTRLKINVPVRILGAMTTHRSRELTIQHHLHVFSSPNDSIRNRADLDIIHTLKAGSWLVKFADPEIPEIPVDEALYYGAFVTDDRGMRNFIAAETFGNSLDFQFRYLHKEPDIPAHLLRVGLELKNVKLNQEPEESKINELYLNASGQVGISKRISIDGRGYFGLLDASGEFRLDANARLKLFKDATTWAQLNLYQRNPSMIENRLFINQAPVWTNDFRNVSKSSLQLNYVHPSIQLRIHGAAHLVTNMIYYDAERKPRQLDETVEILQMSVSKELQLGFIGLLGHLMLQEYDLAEVGLPHLIFNGQLFYSSRWFKKNLLVRSGLDILVTDTYTGTSYFPVTGQFYFRDDFEIPQYPAVDVFFSMQVKDVFMAFAKMENITTFFTDDHYFEVAEYPHFEGYFRLGLWMKLFD